MAAVLYNVFLSTAISTKCSLLFSRNVSFLPVFPPIKTCLSNGIRSQQGRTMTSVLTQPSMVGVYQSWYHCSRLLPPSKSLAVRSTYGQLFGCCQRSWFSSRRTSVSKTYSKFRDRMKNRNKKRREIALKSFNRFKDAYSDKRVIESGVDLSKMSLYQRMKYLLTHYGKVFIPLHYVFLSPVWFSACYAAVYMGLDLRPLLDSLSDDVKHRFHLDKLTQYKNATLLIQAVAFYKILTPLRYLSSITGTLLIVRHLRHKGYFITPSVKEAVQRSYSEGQKRMSTRRKNWRNSFKRKK